MPRRGGCFYTRCTNAELEAFYKARTGKSLPENKPKNKKWTKQELADLLRNVDRRPWNHGVQFRFLDLLPEMRNMVYRELLPVRAPDAATGRQAPKCKPVILRVCKQIHQEAHGILYGDHEGVVSITPWLNTNHGYEFMRRETYVFEEKAPRVERPDYASFSDSRHVWPSYLLLFANIVINIKATATGPPRLPAGGGAHPVWVVAANQDLYTLVSFLAGSKALKTIRVDVAGSSSLHAHEDWIALLQPLTRLDAHVKVEVVNAPDEIRDAIAQSGDTSGEDVANTPEETRDAATQSEDTSIPNTTSTASTLAELMDARSQLVELERMCVTLASASGMHVQAQQDIRNELARVATSMDIRTVVDQAAEAQLKQSTTAIRAFLTGGIMQRLDRLARNRMKEIKDEAKTKLDDVKAAQNQMARIEAATKEASENAST